MSRRPREPRPHLGRCVLAICVLAGLGALTAPAVPARHGPGEPTFAGALTDLAEIMLCATSLWLAAATLLATLGAHLGTASLPARVAVRVMPAGWRRLLATALGGAILLAPATAVAGPPDAPGIAGLRLPDRPSGAVTTTPHPPRTAPGLVVVRPGDTLWDIAASRLPSRSDDAARAAACARWYAANRAAIGPDPDLLLPGTRLRPPDQDERTKR